MKHTLAKNFFSVLAAAGFLVMAAASAQVNRIHCGDFNSSTNVEDLSDVRSYVLLANGHKVFGKDISWKSKILAKDQISVDGEKYNIRDTKGYFYNGTFYIAYKSGYAKRIVRGKLNVYYEEDYVIFPEAQGRSKERMGCLNLVQKGEEGKLELITSQKDIRKYVQDCPAALKLIDKSGKEIELSIKENSWYLNDIFNTYNRECK